MVAYCSFCRSDHTSEQIGSKMLAKCFGAGSVLAKGTCVEEGAHGMYSFCWGVRMHAGRGWRPVVAGRVPVLLF